MTARDMRSPLLRHGVLGSAVMVALVLLGVFYSVVAGAVDRANTQRRAAVQLEAAAQAAAEARFAARSVLAVRSQTARVQPRYAPRPVAYVRSVN